MFSVCMATYNGERFIEQQIRSILNQLSANDELIVSDDGSKDGTLSIIESIGDSRVRILNGNFHSPVFNFENAIRAARGDVIVLADQDDLWNEGRLEEVLRLHDEGVTLVVAKAELIDADGRVFRESLYEDEDPVRHSILHNLYRNPYTGCCMSFRRELLERALPFPKKLVMHDIWLGLVAQRFYDCVYYKDRALVQFRRYGNNFTATHKVSFLGRIWYRMYVLFKLLTLNFKLG